MSSDKTVSQLIENGVIAVIRMTDAGRLKDVIAAISAGGVRGIEITMTVPNAIQIIAEVAPAVPPGVLVGAGTVIDGATADAVIDAGATFVVGPVLSMPVIETAKRRGVAVMPGCYTPTEILAGWRAGADIIKVFPATSLGPKYFKDVRGPLPDIKLMPTGGVSVENAGEWIKAGAVAVGIGTDLLDKKMIDSGDFDGLRRRAELLVRNVQSARNN